MKKLKKVSLIFFLVFNSYVFGQSELFEKAYKFINLGDYPQAIKILSQNQNEKLDLKYYLLGVCYKKTQDYQNASINFQRSLEYKDDFKDTYYELGQSLYATNELRKSRDAFLKSYKKNYLPAPSLYYVAHISHLLEDFTLAKKYYDLVLKEKSADKKMRQISRYQMSDVLLMVARVKGNPQRYVKKYIIPQMKKSIQILPNSDLAKEIEQRINELEREFLLSDNVLRTGRKLPEKKFQFSAAMENSYDTNVISSATSPEASYFYKYSGYGKYRFVIAKRYIIFPQLTGSYTKYQNSLSSVKQYNSYQYSPTLKISKDHFFNHQLASFFGEFSYTQKSSDIEQNDSLQSEYTMMKYSLGEEFNFFKIGASTVKGSLSQYNSYLESQNRSEYSLSYEQIFSFKNSHLGILYLGYDIIQYTTSEDSNSSLLTFRGDYIVPQFFGKWSLSSSLTYTNSTSKISTIHNVNPGFDLSKVYLGNVKLTLGYYFTLNLVPTDDTLNYNKHYLKTEIRYFY